MQEVRSAYVHIPFCQHRCGYCNFTLVADRPDLVPAFLQALECELTRTLGKPRKMDTLYLGGGTPSYLEPPELEKLLHILGRWLPLDSSGEYCCEMNPLDCTAERLSILAGYGVNRVSLGGQSFNDRKLARLERDHSGKQLRQSIESCHDSIGNLSLDLIFAAPGESMSEWEQDVRAAFATPIRHLSTYGLTIERGSRFYGRVLHQEIQELSADLQLAMYRYIIDFAANVGWEHYEVSSFAGGGARSKHNESYWLGRPWWGFGPGAAAFLPTELSGDGSLGSPTASPDSERDFGGLQATSLQPLYFRTVNHRSTTYYIRALLHDRSPVAERDPITLEQYVRERLVFGLRRLEGVSLSELTSVWGRPVETLFQPFLDRYLDQGWLVREPNDRLRLTQEGLFISDSLWPDLL